MTDVRVTTEEERFDVLRHTLESKYPSESNIAGTIAEIRVYWDNVLENSLQDFAGKNVLDLGCGSRQSADGKQFAPWFCRIVKELGATRVVGIDIASNEGEEFEHHQSDLSDPKCLLAFSDNSFDFVNASACFFPPEEDYKSSPTLRRMTSATQRSCLEVLLREQTERLLREGGIYMRGDHEIFAKQNNQLVRKGSFLAVGMRRLGISEEKIGAAVASLKRW